MLLLVHMARTGSKAQTGGCRSTLCASSIAAMHRFSELRDQKKQETLCWAAHQPQQGAARRVRRLCGGSVCIPPCIRQANSRHPRPSSYLGSMFVLSGRGAAGHLSPEDGAWQRRGWCGVRCRASAQAGHVEVWRAACGVVSSPQHHAPTPEGSAANFGGTPQSAECWTCGWLGCGFAGGQWFQVPTCPHAATSCPIWDPFVVEKMPVGRITARSRRCPHRVSKCVWQPTDCRSCAIRGSAADSDSGGCLGLLLAGIWGVKGCPASLRPPLRASVAATIRADSGEPAGPGKASSVVPAGSGAVVQMPGHSGASPLLQRSDKSWRCVGMQAGTRKCTTCRGLRPAHGLHLPPRRRLSLQGIQSGAPDGGLLLARHPVKGQARAERVLLPHHPAGRVCAGGRLSLIHI